MRILYNFSALILLFLNHFISLVSNKEKSLLEEDYDEDRNNSEL